MAKYFPIQTATSCRLKWGWSSLYLNSGTTASCHRAGVSPIPENFDNFHNTELKLRHRQQMLLGQWPGEGCEYCKNIELSGGNSDRQFQNQIPDVYPQELDRDPTLTTVNPSILEVFFSNTCNLGCVYCKAALSSTIQMEDLLHNGPIIPANKFEPADNQHKNFNADFWNWFRTHSQTLQRFQILGGEPFLQKDLTQLLDFFDHKPHPDLEFNIITNLSLAQKLIKPQLDKLARLKQQEKLKRIDIQVSIDSWDPSQQYVRYGLDLSTFDQNINYLLDQGVYRIGLLSTVNSLTINGLPALATKYVEWNQKQTIFWYLHLVLPQDSVFDPTIFDYSVFESSLKETRNLLPSDSWDDRKTLEVFDGIVSTLKKNCSNKVERQKQLLNFLQQNDKRRNTSWPQQFPWLVDVFEKNHVV